MRRNDTAYGFHVIAGWMDETEDESVMRWARDFGAAMASHGTDSAYIALLAEADQIRGAEHRHRISRLQIGRHFSQSHLVPNRKRHQFWAGLAFSSRMGPAVVHRCEP